MVQFSWQSRRRGGSGQGKTRAALCPWVRLCVSLSSAISLSALLILQCLDLLQQFNLCHVKLIGFWAWSSGRWTDRISGSAKVVPHLTHISVAAAFKTINLLGKSQGAKKDKPYRLERFLFLLLSWWFGQMEQHSFMLLYDDFCICNHCYRAAQSTDEDAASFEKFSDLCAKLMVMSTCIKSVLHLFSSYCFELLHETDTLTFTDKIHK